jgi:hypothetical protein
MARVKSKPKAKQRPVQRAYVSRHRPEPKVTAPAQPDEYHIPKTKPELLEKIGLVLDAVDQKMVGRRSEIRFDHFGDFRKLGIEMETYVEALGDLLEPNTGRYSNRPLVSEAIQEAFGAAPGTVPSWARPGAFLLWIDYVPCLCVWGGFADPEGHIQAIDPKSLWMSPAGSLRGIEHPWVPSACETPGDLFRTYLRTSTTATAFTNGRKPGGPAFNLHTLNSEVKVELRAYLAKPENAWAVAALRRGPVNPIPLPAHLQTVQMPLFA